MDSKVLGARIRAARERLTLTQEEFAAAVGKDQRAISEYESGKRRLSAIDLPAFAKALDVSVLYFYEGEISPHDLDHTVLTEFHYLPTIEAKQTAIQILRLLSTTVNLHLHRST